MAGKIQFGVYELDREAAELRKHGVLIRLQEQPLQVLLALVERPGQIVTREEIRQRIWGQDTFVDFEQSLNKAVNRLREALCDDAAQPRYVETIPRRGYRFIAPVTTSSPSEFSPPTPAGSPVFPSGKESAGTSGTWFRKIRWLLTAGVLGGLGIVALVLFGKHENVGHSESRHLGADLRTVPFTTYPGEESYPSFSPDGNQIAFAWTGRETKADAGLDLYVKQVGSEKPLRLTAHPAESLVPAWSPDGRSIAFIRGDSLGSAIFLIPALGGPERKLLQIGFMSEFESLSWSPDGKWLAFSAPAPHFDKGPFAQVNLFNVETYETRAVPQPSPDCLASIAPAFSTDGKSLAFVCWTAIRFGRMYVQTLDGGATHELVRKLGTFDYLQQLAWSADSRWIVYGLLDDGLWRILASGGKPEKLPFPPEARQVAVARSGNRLAYVQRPYLRREILRLDLSSSSGPPHSPVKIVTSSKDQGGARISPDGQRLTFQSNRSGAIELWVCDLDGANPLQLTFFGSGTTGAAGWSPDSRTVVTESAEPTGNSQLYLVSVDGGPVRRLPTGAASASLPFWSADGNWIYFTDMKEGGIWKVSVQGGTSVHLTGDRGLRPQESADATRVFYAHPLDNRDGAELRSVSVSGGDDRPVAGMPIVPSGAGWVPAREGIYFIDGSVPSNINLFDPATKQIHRVAKLSGRSDSWNAGPSISRDGRTMVFGQASLESAGADIMLVEGFR